MTALADRETLNNGVVPGVVEDFRCDEEFRRLNPPLSEAELAELEALLVADGGAKDAFVVWQEEQLLLDGYNRASICERLGLPFTTRLVSVPDREAARTWILRHQSGRRNLTPEGLAYLRGKRFQVEKGRQGGTGANQYSTHKGAEEQRCQNDISAQQTSQRLATEFNVSPRTVARDAKFTEAVDMLAEDADILAEDVEEIKRLVLSRGARISRVQAMRLADLPSEERQHALKHLVETGELLGSDGRQKPKAKVLLPRKPKDFAESVVRLLGLRRARAIQKALVVAIQAEQEGKSASGTVTE
jgi:AraC-like DNA-binding protein